MSWFKTDEKAALDKAVRDAARPATRLLVEGVDDGHVFAPTESHFGGSPYAEAGESWPTRGDEKRPYDFVCQINLHDCPHRPDIPVDLITVWCCWAAVEDVDVDTACIVRGYQEAAASRAVALARPASLANGEFKVTPCSVRTEEALTYPYVWEKHPAIVAAASKFKKPEDAHVDSWKRIGWYGQYFSRVGGYPSWVQDNTLEHDGYTFVAQIDYEPDANNCIQDAGPIYIAARANEPTTFVTDAFQSF
jgi:uncharacterized protein YwqG